MVLSTALLALALASGQAVLQGWVSLDADTLMPGPDSGHFIEAEAGIELPFQGQPAQGFSAILPDGGGGYLALADNGFGSRENSADFLLRIYFLRADFRTAKGGSGTVRVEGFLNLSDPHQHLPWPLTADREYYDPEQPQWGVDRTLSVSRLLTGADLDPESMQRSADNTIWIGEEFGPFVVQFDPDGAVAGPPLALNGLASESNPDPKCCDANDTRLPASRGFEGMAMSPSGERLYPMLEGELAGHPGERFIYTIDTGSQRFLNADAEHPSYRYRPEPAATAVADFVLFTETLGLVLERDSRQGADARHKKIFRIDLDAVDADGVLLKAPVADLLNVSDPDDLDRDGSKAFSFPFHTPEGLIVVDRNTIGVINDNNYPFGRGREGKPGTEATEIVLLTVPDLW